MKIAAVVSFVFAVLGCITAVSNVVLGGSHRPDRPEHLVGYAVGSFLVPIVFLIVGLLLWNKSNKPSGRP